MLKYLYTLVDRGAIALEASKNLCNEILLETPLKKNY